MRIGDVVPASSLVVEGGNPEYRASATFKARGKKGRRKKSEPVEVFYLVCIGAGHLGDEFDAEAALNGLGWKFDPGPGDDAGGDP